MYKAIHLQTISLLICFLFGLSQAYAENDNVTVHSPIPITLEFAKTSKELSWGLMGRAEIPSDHGMLFIYAKPNQASIWMFNVLFDISVAFLDINGIIRQIDELKSYPEKLDPKRPVTSPFDMVLYPQDDPIFQFFKNKIVTSTFYATYAIEMNGGWFEKNAVKIGDVMRWDEKAGTGTVIQTIDISHYNPAPNQPIHLMLSEETPIAVWQPKQKSDRKITFLDADSKLISAGTLKGGEKYPIQNCPVLISDKPVKEIVIENS
jgi:uncharacterized protein